jgi:acetyltransferase-like isoleucine patch superfamily enzyme
MARVTSRIRAAWQRAWAHACLAAAITTPLDASVVILGVPEVHGTGRITLGRNLYLYRDLYLETQAGGEISIGADAVMSRGVHVVAFDRISIGEGTMIGEYTSLRDANHIVDERLPLRQSGHSARAIVIGRNVWIGRGVTILGGVTIGDGAVIGANAVVTHNIPAGAVAAGVPARLLQPRAVA